MSNWDLDLRHLLPPKLSDALGNIPGDPDPRTTSLLFMNSIWTILLILLLFLTLIYWIGPTFMRNKEPFNIYPFLVWHNTLLVGLNLILGTCLLVALLCVRYSVLCEPVHKNNQVDDIVAYLVYSICLLKLIELLDALYLVAKKLQPPFILIFHHSTIVIMVWLAAKYAPGGSTAFPLFLNSWVHVLVYLHFKYSKRWMTPIQSRKMFITIYFIQFTLVFIMSCTCVHLDCGYPRWIAWLSLVYNLTLMCVYSKTLIALLFTEPLSRSVITAEGDSSSSDSSSSEDVKVFQRRRKRK